MKSKIAFIILCSLVIIVMAVFANALWHSDADFVLKCFYSGQSGVVAMALAVLVVLSLGEL